MTAMATDTLTTNRPRTESRETPPELVAVIDIGTTSIRMAIAEIHADGRVRTINRLAQAVHIGQDTFTKGAVDKSTIEDCVAVLRSYRNVLAEYDISQSSRIRVVATSAVREASNQLALIDRIFSATGFQVEAIDEAEVSRITYLSIQPLLDKEPALESKRAVITEVGGGSTEVLVVRGNDVLFAQTYRLGSIRLREMLEVYRTPKVRLRHIMQSQIRRTVDEVVENVRRDSAVELIALGGDVRFAASQLLPSWNPDSFGRIPVDDFVAFTDKMLSMSDDEIVQQFGLTYPDAETLGPSLLAYVELAQALDLDHVMISNVNLRDGLINEFALRGRWSDEFNGQIIRAALALGRKFDYDADHATHVAELSKQLFRALQNEHELDSRYELLLYVAALLHEIGQFVGTAAYHKHSMYLIENSELFGLSKNDLLIVALVARYHRRSSPKPDHEGYAQLDRERRIAVSKMAAILRVADALENSHSGRVKEIHCHREKSRLVISAAGVEDLSLEQLALQQKGPLFEEIFGLEVLLRTGRPE